MQTDQGFFLLCILIKGIGFAVLTDQGKQYGLEGLELWSRTQGRNLSNPYCSTAAPTTHQKVARIQLKTVLT